jgi:hypothetical protein
LRIRAIQEPVFSVANTDFEDGDDDHGYGDCIFLVIYAQPSHKPLTTHSTALTVPVLYGRFAVGRKLNSLRVISILRRACPIVIVRVPYRREFSYSIV